MAVSNPVNLEPLGSADLPQVSGADDSPEQAKPTTAAPESSSPRSAFYRPATVHLAAKLRLRCPMCGEPCLTDRVGLRADVCNLICIECGAYSVVFLGDQMSSVSEFLKSKGEL
jgi:hypothetical protein